MKVRELIERLQEFDGEMEVRVEEEIYYCEVSEVFADWDDDGDDRKVVVMR